MGMNADRAAGEAAYVNDAHAITLADYYAGRDVSYASELTGDLRLNAQRTVSLANALLDRFGQYRSVNSGWRPALVNATTPGAAQNSKHMLCQAIDLHDPDGDLDEWCLDHPDVLEQLGLWQEFPGSTKGWTHVQIVPPKSGKRVFYP